MTGDRGTGGVVGCGLEGRWKSMWKRRKTMKVERRSDGDGDDQRYGAHGLLY